MYDNDKLCIFIPGDANTPVMGGPGAWSSLLLPGLYCEQEHLHDARVASSWGLYA